MHACMVIGEGGEGEREAVLRLWLHNFFLVEYCAQPNNGVRQGLTCQCRNILAVFEMVWATICSKNIEVCQRNYQEML